MSHRVKVVLIIAGLLTIAFYLFYPTTQKTEDGFFISSKNVLQKTLFKPDNLQALINTELSQQEETWAVAVKNLKTNKTYFYNENESFSSASLYKLAVMWAVFEKVNNGEMALDDPVGNTTVEDAVNTMITVSDNDSALALAETIGWDEVEKVMESEGLYGFRLAVDDPQVTAKSLVDLFERIYRNTAITKDASGQMKEFLLGQTINDRIPKYLPQDVKVAHKTGELDFVRHDAGIVYGKKADYIFVFLTSTNHPGDTPEEIALLSKKIFDELEK